MATKPLPSQDVLNQLLRYEPETGLLYWRKRDVSFFEPSLTRSAAHICSLWNVRYADKIALNCISVNGYKEGPVLGSYYKAHRLIWKMQTGADANQIDHIDGNRSNNKWVNLRNTNQYENQRNAKKRSDNTTGVVGVYYYPFERKEPMWLAKISSKTLGYFKTFDEAVAARRAAEIKHNFHPNHGRD